MSYKIYPLMNAVFKDHEASCMTYLSHIGEKLDRPIIYYVIRGNSQNILVDTGCANEEWARTYHRPIVQPEEMSFENGLRSIGLSYDDITCVINTHLHWDHCWNNDKFPGRKIFLQKKELEFAEHPNMDQAPHYDHESCGLFPAWKKAPMEQYEIVDGDVEIFPGITLVTLPGHTPGFQGVKVETSQGIYLIASDAVGDMRCWYGDARHKHIPCSVHVDISDVYRTFEKIEDMKPVRILPGHDFYAFEQLCYPPEG